MNPLLSAWGSLIRTGFRLLYHEMSWSYDTVSHVVSLGHWQEWRRACRPFLVGPVVLELGFGPGHLQVELSEWGFQPVGLDASRQMAQQASRRLQAANHPPALVNGQAQYLPFPARRFNSVVATFPTPYIAEESTLLAVRRVLAPGGRLVIIPEAELEGGGPVQRVIDAAYRLTGQRPSLAVSPVRWSDLLCDRMSAVGLAAEIHDIPLPGSRVTAVVGENISPAK
ncbi:MAG: class I SAM-dependent methyltransferase [Chloroflexota bacterium]